jgi:hypothetical protein
MPRSLRLALRPSLNELAGGLNDNFFLASYYSPGQHMRIAVLVVTVTRPISDFVAAALAEASRGDLSPFAAEVERIKAATLKIRAETEQERLGRLYNEALHRVHMRLLQPLQMAIESSGLRPGAFEERPLDGWPPTEYGGAASLPRWGIDTLRSPWLTASIGVVHRAQPTEDLNDLAVTVLLTRVTTDSQHTYVSRLERFEPGAPRLDQIIDELRSEIEEGLLSIIEDFLDVCAVSGVPR